MFCQGCTAASTHRYYPTTGQHGGFTCFVSNLHGSPLLRQPGGPGLPLEHHIDTELSVDTRSTYSAAAQSSSAHLIHQPQPPSDLDYRHMPPHPARYSAAGKGDRGRSLWRNYEGRLWAKGLCMGKTKKCCFYKASAYTVIGCPVGPLVGFGLILRYWYICRNTHEMWCHAKTGKNI